MIATKKLPPKVAKEYWTIRIEATPARRRIIKEFRKRNFKNGRWTDGLISSAVSELAFIVPEKISEAANFVARYQDAEGSTPVALHQITSTVAARWRKGAGKSR